MATLAAGWLRSGLNWVFPLTVFAFAGPMVKYVQIIFNGTTRWLVLGLLVAYLVHRGTLLISLRSAIGPILAATIYWTTVTTGWSEQPQLTLYKSLALALVALSFTSAGLHWAVSMPPRQVFSYMLPLAGLAIFAALWPGASANISYYGDTTIYSGLSGNPNALGMLCAMGFAGTIAALAHSPQSKRARLALWLVTGLLILIALWAKSRASVIIMFCTGVGLLIARRKVQQVLAVVFVAWLGLVASLAFPSLITRFEATYVRKGISTEAGGVLHSRREVWMESFEQAMKGGWIGGGYGVTIGERAAFDGGVSSVGYGREKANSQLAIVEETGWIGFALYVMLVLTMLRAMLTGYAAASDETGRMNLGIAVGAVVGFLLHSGFEAWWVAPGSPEAPFFWALTGVAIGLATIETKRRRNLDRTQQEERLQHGATLRRPRGARIQPAQGTDRSDGPNPRTAWR